MTCRLSCLSLLMKTRPAMGPKGVFVQKNATQVCDIPSFSEGRLLLVITVHDSNTNTLTLRCKKEFVLIGKKFLIREFVPLPKCVRTPYFEHSALAHLRPVHYCTASRWSCKCFSCKITYFRTPQFGSSVV